MGFLISRIFGIGQVSVSKIPTPAWPENTVEWSCDQKAVLKLTFFSKEVGTLQVGGVNLVSYKAIIETFRRPQIVHDSVCVLVSQRLWIGSQLKRG